MKVELIFTEGSREFFDDLKSSKNELVIPLDKWNTLIHDNLGSNRYPDPEYKIVGAYVVTQGEF